MGNNPICCFCGFCDKNRVNNGKIRCTRWSIWVNPNDTKKCYFEWFDNEYSDPDDFRRWRNNIGALLLLHKSINASLNDALYINDV